MANDVICQIDPKLIKIANGRRSIDHAKVEELKASIEQIGLRTPITVRRVDHAWLLVAGLQRLTAILELGHTTVPCLIEAGDDLTASMWEIAENLHRADLTEVERAKLLVEYMGLVRKRDGISSPNGEKKAAQGRPKDRALLTTSKETGVSPVVLHRAKQLSKVTPAAAAEAKKLGVGRDGLMKAAKGATAADQINIVRRIRVIEPPRQEFQISVPKIDPAPVQRIQISVPKIDPAPVQRFQISVPKIDPAPVQRFQISLSKPDYPYVPKDDEGDFRALCMAWRRASAIARKRFMAEFGLTASPEQDDA